MTKHPRKHEEKACPRCGNAFECKVGDIANCQCNGIRYSDALITFVNRMYDDCLCRTCLEQLSNKPDLIKELSGN